MAEESTTVAPAQEQQQQPAATEVVENVSEKAASVLSDLGSFLSPERRAELEALTKAPATQQPAANNTAAGTDNPGDQQQPGDTAAAGENADGKDKQGQEPEKKPEPEKKSIFGTKKTGKTAAAITIEKPEQILDVIKMNFGQEYKDIKETSKFFETAQGWRKDAEKLKTVDTELSTLKKDIEGLPQEFFVAFSKMAKGEDWKEAFTGGPKVDYTVPFEKQDIKNLVNTYFPGKFTDQDFAEQDKSEMLKLAEEAVKKNFDSDKKTYDANRAAVKDQASKRAEAQKAAVSSSVTRLKERFPKMDEEFLQETQSIMEGGAQNILSLFLNQDGTVKPEAAIMLMMAKYGEQELLPQAMEVAANIAESRANEDLVTRGADGPKPKQGSGAPETISPELKKQLDEIKRAAGPARTF